MRSNKTPSSARRRRAPGSPASRSSAARKVPARRGGPGRREPAHPQTGRSDGAATRERLLRATATLVAERGFAGATVREICRRARTNVASVNYHFRCKADLHAEAIRFVLSQIHEPSAPKPGGPPRERFRAAVLGIARSVLGADEPWQTRFIVRAVLESPEGADVAVREFMEPRIRALEAAIRPLRPHLGARELRLLALSVVGQIVYHRIASPVALRLLGERAWTDSLRNEVACHVAAFSERGLAYAAYASGDDGAGAAEDAAASGGAAANGSTNGSAGASASGSAGQSPAGAADPGEARP
ncbi:MAG: hypothetical protein HMLKMBBP_03958 [Planctomycetes bacterium]|nr:hypothetical protein [Planctomycetota bacterium]